MYGRSYRSAKRDVATSIVDDVVRRSRGVDDVDGFEGANGSLLLGY